MKEIHFSTLATRWSIFPEVGHKISNCGVELCLIYYNIMSIACLGFFEFPWMEEILIRCTFIFEDVPQSTFVDFLDFSSVSFSVVVQTWLQ